ETPKGVLETECVVPKGDQAWETKPLITNPDEDIDKVRYILGGTISLEGYDSVREAVGDEGVAKVMTHLPINFWMGCRDTAGTRSVVDLYRRPEIVRDYLALYLEMWLIPLVEEGNEHEIDIMWLDGTYTGYLNNRMFQDYVLPDLRSVTKRAEFPIILFLSGGPCDRFVKKVRDSGVECLEGLEPPPTGDIILSDVKKRIGDDVCLKGNLDTTMLETGSPSKVEEKVKECIDAASFSGGYILSAVDQPTPRTPVENMIALVKAGRRFGKY
ncbi:MAG: uroporphyrinogen decarboxylase family protein, partial [Thermoproteota archaeon]